MLLVFNFPKQIASRQICPGLPSGAMFEAPAFVAGLDAAVKNGRFSGGRPQGLFLRAGSTAA